jgi:hypothetical protein
MLEKRHNPFYFALARWEQLMHCNKGRIERIFNHNSKRYSQQGIQYSTRLVDLEVNEISDPKYLVVATIEHDCKRGITNKISRGCRRSALSRPQFDGY